MTTDGTSQERRLDDVSSALKRMGLALPPEEIEKVALNFHRLREIHKQIEHFRPPLVHRS